MDKNKIFETASRYASKGQLDKAAKEYQRILDEDAKDVRALQKLAEVLQKSGKTKESTDLMLRVAEGFTEQGFFLKAVAVYKQALKVGPERIEVNQKLASLYQQLGLVGDATQQYQIVATYFDQQGNVKESLAALRKMVDLDPDSVASQVKLGELYAREKMTAEAVSELKKAAVYLKRNNRTEDYLRVLDRISQIAPDDAKLARELAEAFLANGDTKRALARLQVCFRANPKDVDTLELLASAFSALGQEARTVSVYRELAAVHAGTGNTDAERQTLQRILEIAPGDEESVNRLRDMGFDAEQEAEAVIAPPPPPPRPPVRATLAPQKKPSLAIPPTSSTGTLLDMPKLVTAAPAPRVSVSKAIQKVLTEADVYMQYGLLPKAADRVRKALAEEPTSLPLHEKLLAVLDRSGDPDNAVAQLVAMIEIARENGDADQESAYTQDLAQRAPDHPLVTAAAAEADLPELEGEIQLDDMEGEGEVIDEAAEGEEYEEGALEPEEELLVDGDEQVGEQNTGEWSTDDIDEIQEAEAESIEEDPASEELEPESMFEDSPEAEGVHDAHELSDSLALSVAADDAGIVSEPPSPQSLPGSVVTAPHAMTEPSLPPASDEARLQLELSGPISLPALSTELPGLELVDASSEPEPEAIPEEAPPPEEAPAEEPSPESNEAYAEAAAPEEPEAASAEEPAFTDELEEAEFLIQQDSLDDAREALNTILAKAPNHAGALALLQTITPPVEEAAPPPPEPAPAPEPESGGFDLGRELADEFAAFDAPGSEAKLGEKTPDASRGMLDLGGVKLETKVAQEDSQTHFDLGIAYKEMGMFDEALHEFEVAQKGTGSRHVLDCLMMIGLCHIERGDAPKALEQFKAALKTPGLTLAASKELHYEIAHCHEMVGEKQLAIDHLSRVFKADPAYRDTKMRLATLMGKVKSPGSIAPSISGKPKSPKSIAPGKVKAPKSIAPKSVAPKVQNGTSHPPEIEPEPSPDVPPEPPRGSPSRAGGRRKIGYI